MSLKTALFEAIKGAFPNTFSQERVEALAKSMGRKISNAERRLRELSDGDDPRIRPVRSEKGHVIGYLYVPPRPTITIKIPPKQEQMFDTRRMYRV